jgi:hypothetical protein
VLGDRGILDSEAEKNGDTPSVECESHCRCALRSTPMWAALARQA